MINIRKLVARFSQSPAGSFSRTANWYKQSNSSPIVPQGNVVGTALIMVIAIMTFLACLTFGAVSFVRETASVWQSQISKEATIQIKPVDGQDIDALLMRAVKIAEGFSGVISTHIIDRATTARLLEPWLGTGINIDELPIPRLIIVSIDEKLLSDFSALRAEIARAIPGASFDNHRAWVDHLVSMGRTTVLIGLSIFVLVITATILTVIFATRSAMAGNSDIIEVLHFIGAEVKFVASEFERHFFRTALKGALYGGGASIFVFSIVSWWSSRNLATPEADQTAALFGNFAMGKGGYLGMIVIVIMVSFLTMITARLTVIRQLSDINNREF